MINSCDLQHITCTAPMVLVVIPMAIYSTPAVGITSLLHELQIYQTGYRSPYNIPKSGTLNDAEWRHKRQMFRYDCGISAVWLAGSSHVVWTSGEQASTCNLTASLWRHATQVLPHHYMDNVSTENTMQVWQLSAFSLRGWSQSSCLCQLLMATQYYGRSLYGF